MHVVWLKGIYFLAAIDGMGGLPTQPELATPKKRSNPQMWEKPPKSERIYQMRYNPYLRYTSNHPLEIIVIIVNDNLLTTGVYGIVYL